METAIHFEFKRGYLWVSETLVMIDTCEVNCSKSDCFFKVSFKAV